MRSYCDRPIHLLFAFRRTIHNLSRVKQDGWKTMSSERHFANAHLEVVTDQVQTPTRSKPRSWTVVHRKAAVIIAPMTRDGKIVLICQERIPIRTTIWEMPAGQIDNYVAPPSRGHVAGVGLSAVASAKVDDPGHRAAKKIEQVALRELREEAGYELAKDGELIALGYYFTSPGFTDERGYFFLARPVELSPDYVRDDAEAISDCRAFSVPEISRMIAENEIRDANTLSICARLATRGFLSLELR
jgi:ADP-ribose pyrophosphatase